MAVPAARGGWPIAQPGKPGRTAALALAHEAWPSTQATANPGQPLAMVHCAPRTPTRPAAECAIDLLQQRGFSFIGRDPVGLPCYRSPSGALLISVGSCRALAYAPVGGRYQVIASSRTAALVCRITVPAKPVS
jgi:hypothetical protein